MGQSNHCLLIGLRPSDLVEIADTARALAGAGHRVTLLYLYAGTEIEAHRETLQLLTQMSAGAVPGLTAIALDMLAIHRGAFDAAQPIAQVIDQVTSGAIDIGVPPSLPVAPGLTAKVVRRLRDPRGTAEVLISLVPAFLRLARHIPLGLWTHAVALARRSQDATLVYRRFGSFFARAIEQWAITAVVVPEDIVGPVWPVLVAAAHSRGVPVIVCPYTLANQQEAVQSLKSEPAFQASANPIAIHLHPEWRFKDGDVDLVRLPSEHILAHHELGITPPDPWMMNSGYADRILVDSAASFDYFRAAGIPADRMRVAGSVSLDRMHRLRLDRDSQLETLRAQLGLAGAKPLLLISGCPDQLSAKVPFCEFANMDEVARYVGESVAELSGHYHLVVRPHPNFTAFAERLAPFGIVQSLAPTASLVPLADLFIAFASATIRWSMACGIPAVNYDVFHYGYGDFITARGVATVDGSGEFRAFVRSLTPGSPNVTALAERARADSARWGVMDGKGLERIEAEILSAQARRQTIWKETSQHA